MNVSFHNASRMPLPKTSPCSRHSASNTLHSSNYNECNCATTYPTNFISNHSSVLWCGIRAMHLNHARIIWSWRHIACSDEVVLPVAYICIETVSVNNSADQFYLIFWSIALILQNAVFAAVESVKKNSSNNRRNVCTNRFCVCNIFVRFIAFVTIYIL